MIDPKRTEPLASAVGSEPAIGIVRRMPMLAPDIFTGAVVGRPSPSARFAALQREKKNHHG